MIQSGADWLDWRSQGIGSSDAPIIMGVSPYETVRGLWELKTGRKKNDVDNFYTRRGHRLEPIARAHYELQYDEHMPAACLIAEDAPWLRASLDGFNGNKILEIKAPGRVDHETALMGMIPKKYYPQLQHQMIVANVDEVAYWSFDGETGALVSCPYDEPYALEYLEKAFEFWHCVETDQPPEYVRYDFLMTRDASLKAAFDLWSITKKDKYLDILQTHARTQRIRIRKFCFDGEAIFQVDSDGNLQSYG